MGVNMKNRKNIKKIRNQKKIVLKEPKINVERKREIVLVRSHLDKKSEEEIRAMQLQFLDESKKMKEMYFSLNTPIIKVRQRSFGTLARKFVHEIVGIKGGKSEIKCQS